MSNLNRIKVVLVEKQKTGKLLAEQLGKSNCTVSKWCSNTIQPDLKTFAQIARLLNVKITDLINE
jgi:transcriptional regulator with XRE-family HTH domain